MCGIAGWIRKKESVDRNVLQSMTKALSHRGPDNMDTKLLGKNHSVGLGHARLSIIDLSEDANQPMRYGDLTIVFNGEIYNFREIKKELNKLGHKFTANSDTEVILHAFQEWKEKCVNRFIGMFVFAVFDENKNDLFIFGDRTGVKPLYYSYSASDFIFGSELKALCEVPNFSRDIDLDATGQYFKVGYVPAPRSIYKSAKKLEPAHYLRLNLNNWNVRIEKYWNVFDFYRAPKFNLSYEEARDELERLLISAYNYRMVSDVPVGIFLSGGYDSSSIAAIVQKTRSERVKTFTIGFEEGNNEAPEARKIARYLGTEHTEYTCTTRDAQDIIPSLSYFYDEPFADSSAIPTMLVSRIARKDVAVALSADGGDETFLGYGAYDTFMRFLKISSCIPSCAHKIAACSAMICGNLFDNSSLSRFGDILKVYSQCGKYSSAFEILTSSLDSEVFKFLKTKNASLGYSEYEFISNPLEVLQAIDYVRYLPGDIMTKVDRATMSVSLEGREPLLDHRLIEFSARLPVEYKYSGGIKKKIFKDIVHRYIPKELMDRPKSGFTLPINNWLRGDLRIFLEDFLSPSSLRKTGIFNLQGVEKLKNNFLKKNTRKDTIWKILQFQMWAQRWL